MRGRKDWQRNGYLARSNLAAKRRRRKKRRQWVMGNLHVDHEMRKSCGFPHMKRLCHTFLLLS